MKTSRLAVSVASAMLLCLTTALAQPRLPSNIIISPVDPGLRKELAAFSGTWVGKWSGILEATLIVEQIDSEKAKIIYAWGDAPQWRIAKGYSRHVATVTPGDNPSLEFGRGFNVRMNSDLNSLTISRNASGEVPRTDIETFVRAKS